MLIEVHLGLGRARESAVAPADLDVAIDRALRAERAIEQIALLVLQTGTRLGRDDVHHYVRSTVDVFVQLALTGGRRPVADIMLPR